MRLVHKLGADEQRDPASRDEGDGWVRGSPARIGREPRRHNELELREAVHGSAAKTIEREMCEREREKQKQEGKGSRAVMALISGEVPED